MAEETTEETTVDFTAEENIAYGKKYGSISHGSYYVSDGQVGSPNFDSGANMAATDGDISTYHSTDGGSSDDGNGGKDKALIKGVKFYLDLTAVHKIHDITVYGKSTTLKLYAGKMSVDYETRGDYKLIDADGNLAVPIATTVTKEDNLVIDSTTVSAVHYEFEDIETRYITFEYDDEWSYSYNEIYVNGSPISVDVITDNIAVNKPCDVTIDRYNKTIGEAFDGDITTKRELQGTDTGNMTAMYYVDLEDNYKLTELTIYLAGSKSTNIYLGTNSVDDKTLIANIDSSEYETVNVNGTNILRKTYTFSDEVARYVTIEYPGKYSSNTYEVVIKGEKVTTLTDSTKTYSYDATTGVTASVELFNGAETASPAGKVYFAAYSGDVLVGVTIADAASLEKGASQTIAPAAFAVTAEPTSVKAFYWTDKLVPVLDIPTEIK